MALSIFNIKHMYWEDDNTTSVDYYELIADTMSDIPHDMYYFSTDTDKYKMAQGSMVYVVSDGTVYMCDSTGAWIEQESGGGGGSTLIEKSISANGVYNASEDSADGYSKVTVDVPNTYTAEDEGKVVDNGALVAQTAMSSEVTENGTVDTTLYNSVTVNVPSGGGTSQPRKDVNFYDYDGTIVNSYTAAEFAELTAMPSNPSHDGLTAQGWNWSLSDAKSYVASYGKLEIGQMYITSDGKTRLYITLAEGRTSPILQLYLNANSELDIDWGDGSTHSTFTSTSADYKSKRHDYATAGDYVISIKLVSGAYKLQSASTKVSTILWNNNNSATSPDLAYNCSIKKVELASDIDGIYAWAFGLCSYLECITMPNSIKTIGQNAFNTCRTLSHINIPSSVTEISANAFSLCYTLSSISLSNHFTYLRTDTFRFCTNLKYITVPNSVNNIDACFNYCYVLPCILIPNSVNVMTSGTFNGCYSLATITIDKAEGSLSGSPWGASTSSPTSTQIIWTG